MLPLNHVNTFLLLKVGPAMNHHDKFTDARATTQPRTTEAANGKNARRETDKPRRRASGIMEESMNRREGLRQGQRRCSRQTDQRLNRATLRVFFGHKVYFTLN